MKIDAVELVHVSMPLVAPFRTSFGTQTSRDVLLLRLRDSSGGQGWGECVAPNEPGYSSEYVAGADLVLRSHLLPPVLHAADVTAPSLAGLLAGIPGHFTAKAALEMAVLDLELRAAGMSRALRGLRGHPAEHRRTTRRGGRLPRRRLPADQAQD